MSVITIATIFPIPEHREEVIAAFEAAIKQVHNEPGVELYALNEGTDRVVMVEKYESDEARVAHNNGSALAELAAALHGKLSQGLDVQVLRPHPVGDSAKGAV